MSQEEKKFRVVNQSLGNQPKFGPFPANQIIPFVVIIFVAVFIQQLFQLSWINGILVALWMFGTSWVLMGKHSWRFLAKFVHPPYWVRSSVRYESPFHKVVREKRKERNIGREH